MKQQEKGLNEDWSVTTRQAFSASMSHTPITECHKYLRSLTAIGNYERHAMMVTVPISQQQDSPYNRLHSPCDTAWLINTYVDKLTDGCVVLC